jgi:serine/threonine protein phosphatase PrpC
VTLGLQFAVRSDVGLLRDGNEDSAYAGPRLVAVADGMGGHAAGEVASRLAIASVAALDAHGSEPDVLAALRGAVEQAQHDIRAGVAADGTLEGMGTTLTALLWTGSSFGLAHVGDSRAYLFRDGTLQPITHDHTYVQELVDSEQITADDALSHPQRSLLTRALDGRSTVEPDLAVLDVRVGDRYLLCSDGLSGVVRDATLTSTLQSGDVEDVADQLVELALRGGGPDNITVVICDIVETSEPPHPAVVVGAAADIALPTSGATPPAVDAQSSAATPRRTPTSRRPRWVVLALGLALLGAVLGGWWWTRTQYFVGIHGDRVAIFRGVAWSIGGLSLHSVSEQRPLDPAQLPDFERERLRAGITAATLPQARRVADRLTAEQCVVPAAAAESPTTSATPKPTPSPSPSLAGCSGAAP